ncbi:efflux RND transporter permease subunit [Botrimarina hoheduenensis]|uniref:Multidrug resistance protein MdtC n=1 Tax=Botrimarina hoheduenensis TaxID=2528000 RepID=A0A5C5WG29_9BACT|nr:efflux RND transporter permease subunit [Botrimarina hoheduenensis]TWT48732.1 Multidrug resistance protein MdtC [Botrimarina hoheduenensis]
MKISNAAIDRPRLVTVMTLLVMLCALYAAVFTPVQLGPAITKAVVLVAIPYPDAQPSEAESEIVRKVEDALTELQSVDFIASTSMRGSSVTQIVFLDGVTPDEGRREVKDLIDRIRNELPAGREVQPYITDVDFENMPLMLVTITPPEGFDERTLKTIAEDVQDRIETVDGVANTQLFGGKEREIQVNVNPDLAEEYGVTLAALRQSLAAFHAELPAGAFRTAEFDRQVRNETKLRGVDDIAEAVVRSDDGRVVRVKDVADVIDGYRRVLNMAEFDGRAGATLIVNKEAGVNTLGAARAVKAMVASLDQQYPELQFNTTRDSSAEIWVMFRVLGSSAIFGAMLVLVILAWSMGLRISVLVLLAIPFSMAVALVFLFFTGVPVSNMVVFSFILVLGMVVDGAIIVAENIHRHIERGEEPIEAAKVGIAEVGIPVIAADLTTVAAFLPMLLVPGIMGDFMSVMPKVVSVALIGSIVVDHFIIPTLAARWYRKRPVPPELAAKPGGAALTRTRPKLDFFTRSYAKALRFSLDNRGFVLIWVLLACWGAKALVAYLGFNFFPASDRGQFIVKYELPLGYSVDQTLAASRVIVEPLERWRDTGVLRHYVTSVGSSGALAMRVDEDAAAGPEFGQVQVELGPPMDRAVTQSEVINYLRENIRPLPGMKFTVEEVEDGPPGGAEVAVRLTGKDLDQLGQIATRITARLSGLNGTVDVSTDYRPDSPELVIEPRSDIIGLFGMTDVQVAEAVQIAIAGDNRIQITLDDEDVDLRIQLAEQYQRNPADLGRLMLTSTSGQKTTIGSLAELRRETGLFSINRYDRSRAVVAKCNVDDPVTPSDVFEVLAKEVLPELGFVGVLGAEKTIEGFSKNFVGETASLAEGLQAEFTGENDERDKNFGYLLWSMVIAVVLIAAILVVQFNSFRQSMIVMGAVPLSFIGVVLGMWATGFPFSLATFIGLVSLTGIVVNDAIVLVDFANQARTRGLSVKEALIESGINRLRPVLLTTITTCGGLLPLLLNVSGGAEFWQPLTGAVVFGLAFATLLTLVVIPCCFLVAYNVPKWIWLAGATLIAVPLGVAIGGASGYGLAATVPLVATCLLIGGAMAAQELNRAWKAQEPVLWDADPA